MTRSLIVAAGVTGSALLFGSADAQSPAPQLSLPIDCQVGRTCEVQNYVDHDPGPGAKDYRCSTRTYQAHSGVDIRLLDLAAQRRGVNVLAAADGKVARLRDGVEDLSVRTPGRAAAIKGQECGNAVVLDHGGGWETQYCHLAKGSVAVTVGQVVKAGQPIAKVGLSGNTEYPHLHFTVRQGTRTVDPFAPALTGGACGARGGQSLWTASAGQALRYKEGVILNAGFAGAPVQAADLDEARVAPAGADAPVLAAYGRAIGLSKGDVLEITVRAPGGAVLVVGQSEPMDGPKAQYHYFVGKRRPPQGWASGRYTARVVLLRGGKPQAERTLDISL